MTQHIFKATFSVIWKAGKREGRDFQPPPTPIWHSLLLLETSSLNFFDLCQGRATKSSRCFGPTRLVLLRMAVGRKRCPSWRMPPWGFPANIGHISSLSKGDLAKMSDNNPIPQKWWSQWLPNMCKFPTKLGARDYSRDGFQVSAGAAWTSACAHGWYVGGRSHGFDALQNEAQERVSKVSTNKT